ncbi:MAG: dihydroorotate dehydrogenase-like protein [Chloroflexota bacterium]
MADLTTTYLGLTLKNPIVPSASPLSKRIDDIKLMEDAGAGAVVLYSLFEEQIEMNPSQLGHILDHGATGLADAMAYFPSANEYARTPDDYLEHVRRAKEAVDMPVIASLNGVSRGGWVQYAKKIQQAGADALELNVYFLPVKETLFAEDVETLYLDILREVKKHVTIPVAVKLSPFFSALTNFADRLVAHGADGLVLFNRFYQPDIDVDTEAVRPSVLFSTSFEMRLPLRWVAILSGQLQASLALTTGVHTSDDVIKALLAGADVAMACSVLLKEGVQEISELVKGVYAWMDGKGYESLGDFKGKMSLKSYIEPAAFERGSYMKLLNSYRP